MSSALTFIDLCLAGKVTPDEVDDFVDHWHEASEGRQLGDYLGMTKEEYSLWLRVPDALSYILAARRELTPLADVVADGCRQLRRAARAADRSKLARLEEWLKNKAGLI